MIPGSLKPLNRKIVNTIFVISLSFFIYFIYQSQLLDANYYSGYRSIELNFYYVIVSFSLIIFTLLIIPSKIKLPSDFLALFYAIFVLMPFSVLNPIRGELNLGEVFIYFGVIYTPLLVLKILSKVVRPLRVRTVFVRVSVETVLITSALTIIFVIVASRPESAGFSFYDVYTRRLEGRDIFSGDIKGYVLGWLGNGMAPGLAFLAPISGQLAAATTAIGAVVALFYVVGLKAPLLYVGLSWVLGKLYKNGKLDDIRKYLFLMLFLLLVTAVIEFALFDYSFVSDFFVRRAIAVPPYVVSAYIEFNEGQFDSTRFLFGTDSANGVANAVGGAILGNPDTNANTNAFIYHFVAGGILGYFLACIVVVLVYYLLDSVYKKSGNPLCIFIGFIYALLLTEQAATTALSSSGVAVLIPLIFFSR